VLNILADPVARAPGFGIESALEFPFPAAVKTGTSRHFTDNWAVATTSAFTVAVWVGNFNGRPMDGVSGVTGAGPLMHRVVMRTAARLEPGTLPTPASAGAVPVEVCQLSGLLATDGCPSLTEWFARGTAPTADDDWQRGGRVTLPPQFAEWRSEGGDAMLAASGDGATRAVTALPRDTLARDTLARDTLARDTTERHFRISSPQDGDRYQLPAGVDARYATIALRAEGADASAVRWFIDGRPTRARRMPLVPGTHTVRASAPTAGNDEVHITIEQ
jgi:penicillin-binding protein 1C